MATRLPQPLHGFAMTNGILDPGSPRASRTRRPGMTAQAGSRLGSGGLGMGNEIATAIACLRNDNEGKNGERDCHASLAMTPTTNGIKEIIIADKRTI